MTNFFRFPQTPHIKWIGEGLPREDKLMGQGEIDQFINGYLSIEEKMDGANVGFSLDDQGKLRAQNRGQYIVQPYAGQYNRLKAWLDVHGETIRDCLEPSLILFGEWLAAKHSLDYDNLSDWFMVFDVYDRERGAFWSVERRNELAELAGLATVPLCDQGYFTLEKLVDMANSRASVHRKGNLEGIVARRDEGDWCVARGKIVREDFKQAIEEHWSKRTIIWNRVTY